MLKAVALDFDGVILESLRVKTESFRRLFQDYPGHLDQIVALHLELAGISRFEKFKLIYRDILKEPLNERESQRLGEEFNRLVLESVMRCPFVPGADEFLKTYASQYPLYLISGTPEEELRQIVAGRGLSHYFQGVYGSPQSKVNLLKVVITQNQCAPEEVLYIGDARGDWESAQAAGVGFVGRVAVGQINPFEEVDNVVVVNDLVELALRWEHLFGKTRRDVPHWKAHR